MAKKIKNVWKTKEVSGKRMMICQNSNLDKSKYPDWAPDEGEASCKEWVEVGVDSTAVLCSFCTMRSLHL